MTHKFIEQSTLFLEIASTISKFSKAERRKVGAILVSSDGKIIGTGFNGTPMGTDNCCENANNETFEYVLHAEVNAIFNATTHDLHESTLYVTDSPCIKCSAAILQKGIKTVIYDKQYRLTDGIDFLIQHNVHVIGKEDFQKQNRKIIVNRNELFENIENISKEFNKLVDDLNNCNTIEHRSIKTMQVLAINLLGDIYYMIDKYQITFEDNITLADYINKLP